MGEAKRKFQSIAEAYEVLKDPELRARFLRVRQGGGRARTEQDSTPRGTNRHSTGGSSIAGLRRAGLNAMKQQEREVQAAKEREFAAAQRAEQRRYDDLKEAIKTRLLVESGPNADATWTEWKSQIGAKWLNRSWEEFLPEQGSSDGMKEMLLRDVRKDLREQREREAQEERDRLLCNEAAEAPMYKTASAPAEVLSGATAGVPVVPREAQIPVATTQACGAPMAKRKERHLISIVQSVCERDPLRGMRNHHLGTIRLLLNRHRRVANLDTWTL